MERILLAYSGGLDTTTAIPWLAEHFGAEIVTATFDVGQGRELDDVRERALAAGAARAHVLDLREEFARDFILPALQAGALYERRHPLPAALCRPLIARHLVEIARIEGTATVAHGSSRGEGSRASLDELLRTLDPTLTVVAPGRMWGLSRQEQVEFTRDRGIAISPSADREPLSDTNLWGRSIDFGRIDNAWREPSEEAYLVTRAASGAPAVAAHVEVTFERGVPVATNGVAMSPVELITSLGTIAGVHGVGRIELVDYGPAGPATREICEAPAAVTLHAAHRELQRFVTPRDLARLTADLGVRYADLVHDGHWYTPTREAIDAFVAKVEERVTGTVRLELFRGACRVVGRQSPFAAPGGDSTWRPGGAAREMPAGAGQ
jgi:argininosuccinate synthase